MIQATFEFIRNVKSFFLTLLFTLCLIIHMTVS